MTGPTRGKKVDKSGQIGEGGIALIYQRVNAMGYVWHHRSVDAGVDGTIELRDPATGVVTNRFLQVQSKARNRTFAGENEKSFHYVCDESDLDYWMASEVPVLLVCSHPEREEAWWTHIQGWFTDPVRRASRRVDFDKATQRFDATAATRLMAIGDPHARSHTPIALDKAETLCSNLLRLDVPRYLHSTPLRIKPEPAAIYRGQHDHPGRKPLRHDWALHGGRILTWEPPDATALDQVISGPSDVLSTSDLLHGDQDEFRRLIRLLNNTLRHDTADDCDWHNGRKILYFRATPDLSTRHIPGPNGRSREVFKPKPSKKDPTRVSYYKHAALKYRFVPDGDDWYLELTPTYHYTRDGRQDSRFASDLLSGIKRLEKNQAVLSSTRMWAHYLHGEETLLDERDTVLGYEELETFAVTRGIDDNDWAPTGQHPDQPELAADDAKADGVGQLELFGAAR